MSQSLLPSLWNRALSAVDDLSDAIRNSRFEETLDQEIRQLDAVLKKSVEKHDEFKAQRIHVAQQLAPLVEQKAELEEQALRLLRGRRKTQAKEKAEEIAAIAEQILALETQVDQFRLQEKQCGVEQEETERTLKLRRYQLGNFRASANLQRTQEALASGPESERPATALEALRRIKNAFSSELPNPDDVIGKPPEPVAESSDQILDRLAKSQRSSTPSSKPTKTASKQRKAK